MGVNSVTLPSLLIGKGLYLLFPVPSRPWEIISMDFIGWLPTTKKGNDYLIVVVDRFNKMVILIRCEKIVIGVGACQHFLKMY